MPRLSRVRGYLAPPAATAPASSASKTTTIAASSQQVPVHVTAVNLLVAHGAVPEARRAQVMEGGRHYARSPSGTDSRRQVGVTLQTDLLHYRARQHPWIG